MAGYCISIVSLILFHGIVKADDAVSNFAPLPLVTPVSIKPIPLNPSSTETASDAGPEIEPFTGDAIRPLLGVPPVKYPPTFPHAGVPPASIPDEAADNTNDIKEPWGLPPVQYPPRLPYPGVPPVDYPPTLPYSGVPPAENSEGSENDIDGPWGIPPAKYPPTLPYDGVPPATSPDSDKPVPFYGIPPASPSGQDYFGNNQPILGFPTNLPKYTGENATPFFYGILPVNLSPDQNSVISLPTLLRSVPKTMPIALPPPISAAVCPNGEASTGSCLPGSLFQSGCAPIHACFFDSKHNAFGCCSYSSLNPIHREIYMAKTSINDLNCDCTCEKSRSRTNKTKCICDCI